MRFISIANQRVILVCTMKTGSRICYQHLILKMRNKRCTIYKQFNDEHTRRTFLFNELIVIWDQQHQIWFLSSCKRRNIDHIWDHHLVAPDEDGSHAAGIALWPTFPQELSAEIYHGSCIQRVQTIIKKFKIAKKKKKDVIEIKAIQRVWTPEYWRIGLDEDEETESER